MKIIIRPALDPEREIDLTHRLVSAIAEELWRAHGGNDQLNWLEAERHLRAIAAQARSEARCTRVVFTSGPRLAPQVSLAPSPIPVEPRCGEMPGARPAPRPSRRRRGRGVPVRSGRASTKKPVHVL